MKKIIFLALTLFIVSPAIFAQTKAGKIDSTKYATFYTCPVHDSVSMKMPGSCPICGMKLQLSKKEQMKKAVTNNDICPVHLDVTSYDPGKCPKCGRKMNLSQKEQMKASVMKIYTCPMHPEVALDKEGKCPKCGTTLGERSNAIMSKPLKKINIE